VIRGTTLNDLLGRAYLTLVAVALHRLRQIRRLGRVDAKAAYCLLKRKQCKKKRGLWMDVNGRRGPIFLILLMAVVVKLFTYHKRW
jgi:hypothetical protein